MIGVIGAGPAGSMFSALFSASAREVTLIDDSHPRRKLCGGGLTWKGVELLKSTIGFPKSLVLSKMDRARIYLGKQFIEFDVPEVSSIDRLDFDLWLLNKAINAGSDLVKERVVRIKREGDKWFVKTNKGVRKFDFLVGADGSTSVVRRDTVGPHRRMAIAFEASYKEYIDNTMEYWFFPGGYAWRFPRSDYASVGIGSFRGLSTVSLKKRLYKIFPGLRDAGDRAVRAWSIPFSLARAGFQSFALIGDAAGHTHPISGEGMYYAMKDGFLLASSMKEGRPASYEEKWRSDYGRDLAFSNAVFPLFYNRLTPMVAKTFPWIARRSISDMILGSFSPLSFLRALFP